MASEPVVSPDWRRIVQLLHASRALDEIEETRLVPERKVLYQFSARGHDFAQLLLGLQLTDAHDAVTVYYRSRPMMLALGVSLEDAAAGPLARAGSFSGGRDIGVVFNLPGRGGPSVLPACGGVGAQYTPAAGWAQAIRYRHEVLKDKGYAHGIAVVLGGDASTATNGFWSALNIATTLKLPMLFYIEDNGFGISVPSALADARRQHCCQPALIHRAHDSGGGRQQSGPGRRPDAAGRRPGTHATRAGDAAADGAAPFRPFGAGYPGL